MAYPHSGACGGGGEGGCKGGGEGGGGAGGGASGGSEGGGDEGDGQAVAVAEPSQQLRRVAATHVRRGKAQREAEGAAMRALAGELGVKIPPYGLDRFIQKKMVKVRLLTAAARDVYKASGADADGDRSGELASDADTND